MEGSYFPGFEPLGMFNIEAKGFINLTSSGLKPASCHLLHLSPFLKPASTQGRASSTEKPASSNDWASSGERPSPAQSRAESSVKPAFSQS
jgi:hypothetical protein